MKRTFGFSVFMAIAFSLYAQVAIAQTRSEGPEQALFQSANRERAMQHLAPLKWSESLAEAARQHAVRMAQRNTISHQFPGESPVQERAARTGAHFSTIAENVAEGPSTQNIHQQWMNSPPHRANLLDPQLDSVGIAVAANNGTMFAVEDFSLAVGAMDIAEQERVVSEQLQARGLQLLTYTEDARRSCTLDNGYAGSHMPSFVLHYATSDLQTLPAMLEKRIQTGHYHSAVVGACPAGTKLGFSSYRIAVMLFE